MPQQVLKPDPFPITTDSIRYIKLGAGGSWARPAIEQGWIPFGHRQISEDVARFGSRAEVSRALTELGVEPQDASDVAREIIDFHQLGPDTLWITFHEGRLWWTFAAGPSEPAQGRCGDALFARPARDGWRDTDRLGRALNMSALSGRITKTEGYRRTICRVENRTALLAAINAVQDPLTERLIALQAAQEAIVADAIIHLSWRDFEILADLLLARGGWRRVSQLGGTQAIVDGRLEHPLSGETAVVQVKSRAGAKELADVLGRLDSESRGDQLIFICHSPKADLVQPARAEVRLLAGTDLVGAVVRSGLTEWVVGRAA